MLAPAERTHYLRPVPRPTLAYVFWHSGPRQGDGAGYEAALTAFHEALAESAPPGFAGSAAYAVDGAAWQQPPLYEDWYLLTDWAALGVLNEAAVDARRRGVHDAVAGAVRGGEGSIYALRAGTAEATLRGPALWLPKPVGVPYPGFREELARLAAGDGGVWERQLALGPAPEYCVVTGAGAPAAATIVQRRPVFTRLSA
jgi:hypothetical protein